MKNIKTLVLLVLLLSVGCRSKKIDIQEKDSKTVIENNVTEKEVQTEQTEQKKDVQSEIIKESSEVNKDYILHPKDPQKPIEIIDHEGKKTSILNADVEIKHSEKKDKSTEKNIDNSVQKTTKKSEVKKKDTTKKEDIKSEASTKKDIKSNWFLILLPYIISLVVIVILLLVWIFRKKIPYIRNFFS